MKFLSAVYETLISTKIKTRRKMRWLLQIASSLIQKDTDINPSLKNFWCLQEIKFCLKLVLYMLL